MEPIDGTIPAVPDDIIRIGYSGLHRIQYVAGGGSYEAVSSGKIWKRISVSEGPALVESDGSGI